MDIVNQVADELEKRGQERISEHIYGLRHELIGKPCLYSCDGDLKPAIPYGAYRLSEDAEIHVAEYKQGKPLLVIAYFDPHSSFEGSNVHVKALSAVSPDDLIPVDPSSRRGQEISHTILSWLVDNRDGTFRAEERRRKRLEQEVTA